MAGKAQPKTGGRQAGTPNKINSDLKAMILTALSNVGGAAYLQDQAIKSPGAFLTLIGKVLPTTLVGDANAPAISLKVTYVDPGEKRGE